MERDMAYTADVHRWRGPDSEPYRPHMLESPRPVVEQDGADAVQGGTDAEPDGASWLPIWSGLQRQSRLRRLPHGNAAAAGGRANRIPRFPRSSAARQGQGRVRPVHGP